MSNVASTSQATTSTIHRIFDGQAATALHLRVSSAEERIAKIRRLRDAVLAHTEALYAAAYADFKKPKGEVDLAEILPVCAEANDAMAHLKKWMKPTSVWPTLLTAGTSAQVQYMPRGRCLIISPWNYPVNLTFGPLISAIAAGNTAIIKPSEMTPHLSALMSKIVRETFPANEVALVEGEADVAQALLNLPFDHIFFTGSPAIGKVVMAAAAKHLTSVTLELGGKSPTVVDASANIPQAAQNIMWAKLANAGQTCIAPDHVYVHERVKDEWVNSCRAILEKAYGKTFEEQQKSPHLAHMVNARHTARVKGLMDEAVALGARVLAGGGVAEADCFVAPTLLENIPEHARIMQEEIFGPLLPVVVFTNIDDVIAKINAGPHPLALYIYSTTGENIQRVLQQTASGGACVNHALVHFLHGRLPFGGVKNSGLGHAHGHFGFKAFSHEKAVVRARSSLATRWFSAGEVPPFVRRFLASAFKWI